jgi:hypothetical protein
MTLAKLFTTKKYEVESLISFYQWWRSMAGKYPCCIPKMKLFTMFFKNLHTKLMIQLYIQCCTTIEDIVEKGPFIEKELVEKGLTRFLKTPLKPIMKKEKNIPK